MKTTYWLHIFVKQYIVRNIQSISTDQHSLIVHFLCVRSRDVCLSALSEFRPLPELRIHLERVDLLCCLLNKTRNTEKTKIE